jgi:predicted DsbA family dithiol-disulfide isomerase
VVDLQDEQGIRRAQELGVTSVPAVAVDGKLAGCCQGRGPRKEMLVQAGLGQAIN